jgi:hypothetical protein
MAAQLSHDPGIAYRYGPDAPSCGTANTGTTLSKRMDTQLTSPAPDYPFWWSVGGPPSSEAGSYSSNQADVVFVADDNTQRVGVTEMQVSNYMYNVFAELPQLGWTRASVEGGGIDAITVMGYRDDGIVSKDPIATGRCGGRPGFCAESLVAFQNGVIGSAGSNTAANRTTTQLAPNKIPTAVAMTNDSEFALVTVWDTQQLKGQVAVVALAGLCDNCDPYDSTGLSGKGHAAWYNWWQEWMGTYPGLANMGNIAFMKVLGYVDLPDMIAPTEIAVTTGMDQFKTLYQSGSTAGQFVGYANSPLTDNWQKFASGGELYYSYAKGGMAVVISKSEKKVAFLDLGPLFRYVNGMYFSANVTSTSNLGQGADQWPYPFTKEASQIPTVVKTISLAGRPTAVRTTIDARNDSKPRAWVATQDGTLHIFSLDGYVPGDGWAPVANPMPSAITEVGTVMGLGRNPTSLATSKGEPDDSVTGAQVISAARCDNKISWVRFADDGNSGSIVRTIQHAEMQDLIAVEDADNVANPGYVLSALDYGGKAIRNYRYGPVIFSDGGACPGPMGCPIMGTVAEYGGAMAMPGKPFQMSTANVP